MKEIKEQIKSKLKKLDKGELNSVNNYISDMINEKQ